MFGRQRLARERRAQLPGKRLGGARAVQDAQKLPAKIVLARASHIGLVLNGVDNPAEEIGVGNDATQSWWKLRNGQGKGAGDSRQHRRLKVIVAAR